MINFIEEHRNKVKDITLKIVNINVNAACLSVLQPELLEGAKKLCMF